MIEHVKICVELELLSDTIFGSGQSVPGGEDISVLIDEQGYPYLRGSTIKGLLRESLENLLVWTGGTQADFEALMGKEGWSDGLNPRQIHFTPLRLQNAPADAVICFASRAFTQLEDGLVAEGTLRSALVINRGLRFGGELECLKDASALLLQALSGIKRLGTMRSRGFGKVRLIGSVQPYKAKERELRGGGWFRIRLKTLSPVLVTRLQSSDGNNLDGNGFIIASALRGAVVNALAREDEDWFKANRLALLGNETRFLDLMPLCGDGAPLPAVMGFYEDKKQEDDPSKIFTSIVVNGALDPELPLKRAKIGRFCSLSGQELVYWSAREGEDLRIHRNGKKVFQTVNLSEGQELEGYIYSELSDFGEHLAKALQGHVWLGADRHAGFGKCEITLLENVPGPRWESAYGYQPEETPGQVLYLLAVSPFSMVNAEGMLCGLDEQLLAKRLGVSKLEIEAASTALSEYNMYNRARACWDAALTLYDRGSLFKLRCDEPPTRKALSSIEQKGLGVALAEGFGQVLFLRPELLEGIHRKRSIQPKPAKEDSAIVKLRRAKLQWILDNDGKYGVGDNKYQISRSQLGEIQTLCERAINKGGDTGELLEHLRYNMQGRQVAHGNRFETISKFINNVLSTELHETLGVDCENDTVEKLRLLCMLFDFGRKEEKRG